MTTHAAAPAASAPPPANNPIDIPIHDGPASVAPSSPPSHDGSVPPRKKQKRNKPTLSCDCCVERKTKVGASRRPAARLLTVISVTVAVRNAWPA